MTETQERVYRFIIKFIESNQYSPTVKEICKGLKYKSNAPVQEVLYKLKKQGLVNWNPKKSRTLQLTQYRVKLEKIEVS